jgi:hypothetical protein
MMRRGLAALARRGFAAAGGPPRDGAAGARDVVAAVSELRLPAALQARAEAERAASRGHAADAAGADAPLDLPVQLAPYQALPVDGRITRHFTRGLPVIDPAGRTQEVRFGQTPAVLKLCAAAVRALARHGWRPLRGGRVARGAWFAARRRAQACAAASAHRQRQRARSRKTLPPPALRVRGR